jgi:hypothetical protein
VLGTAALNRRSDRVRGGPIRQAARGPMGGRTQRGCHQQSGRDPSLVGYRLDVAEES